jgi:hypothetical protein
MIMLIGILLLGALSAINNVEVFFIHLGAFLFVVIAWFFLVLPEERRALINFFKPINKLI